MMLTFLGHAFFHTIIDLFRIAEEPSKDVEKNIKYSCHDIDL